MTTVLDVETKEMVYLRTEGNDLVFIDPSSEEQVAVSRELVGDAFDLVTPNLGCRALFVDERLVDVTLPTFVDLHVTTIALGVGGTHRATVETGAVLDVPPTIRVGDTIRIDTRTCLYVEGIERLDD